MTYENIIQGIFLERPNRFIAICEVGGQAHRCHVKNTGRCKELLVPGAVVFLQHHQDPKRKTQYSLISVIKETPFRLISGLDFPASIGGPLLINMDSQAPNRVFGAYLASFRNQNPRGKYMFDQPDYTHDVVHIQQEFTHGNSRFDFMVQTATDKWLIEVKGVTLEHEGGVFFPDAPTERGLKHVQELTAIQKARLTDPTGYKTAVVFVIQLAQANYFQPNYTTHEAFGAALVKAKVAGVQLHAFSCLVTPEQMRIYEPVPIYL